jgi:hypothetical protein
MLWRWYINTIIEFLDTISGDRGNGFVLRFPWEQISMKHNGTVEASDSGQRLSYERGPTGNTRRDYSMCRRGRIPSPQPWES